jgi:DNA-binding NtrC family response regulator
MTDFPAVLTRGRLSTMPPEPRRVRVLVADDDPTCAAGLATLLSGEGFDVSTAANGQDALTSIEASAPDVLLTDVLMPELDGLALLAAVRARFPEVFVVVMSGVDRRAEASLEGGALAFVSKPFELDDLVGVIDAAIQLRDERRQARPLPAAPRVPGDR